MVKWLLDRQPMVTAIIVGSDCILITKYFSMPGGLQDLIFGRMDKDCENENVFHVVKMIKVIEVYLK